MLEGRMLRVRLVAPALLVTLLGGAASCGFPEYQLSQRLERLCDDGLLNGAETDTDCGGPDCQPCSDARPCAIDRDCNSRRCDSGRCQAPTCDDGAKNGTETGRDCGGKCSMSQCPTRGG